MGIKGRLQQFLKELQNNGGEKVNTNYIKERLENILKRDRTEYMAEYYRKNKELIMARRLLKQQNKKGGK